MIAVACADRLNAWNSGRAGHRGGPLAMRRERCQNAARVSRVLAIDREARAWGACVRVLRATPRWQALACDRSVFMYAPVRKPGWVSGLLAGKGVLFCSNVTSFGNYKRAAGSERWR